MSISASVLRKAIYEHAGELVRRTYSMRALIERARSGGEISVVSEGDIVVIVPKAFTGSADFFESPFGVLQGSYFQISAINDALAGRFPKPLAGRPVLVVLAGLIGAAFDACCHCAGLPSTCWRRRSAKGS